uniref:Uncharacterized protein n=1 Tax=Percolomonas cosmopolitus TaxID=63605 RepID=A0A7S1KP18_9EUKA|mmetsp:Transcript_329/g.1186  ORF Transcript_329/g.1186 Transcript_329/m.1186 type:complete len:152 (+) Transcript_329:46-501(+)
MMHTTSPPPIPVPGTAQLLWTTIVLFNGLSFGLLLFCKGSSIKPHLRSACLASGAYFLLDYGLVSIAASVDGVSSHPSKILTAFEFGFQVTCFVVLGAMQGLIWGTTRPHTTRAEQYRVATLDYSLPNTTVILATIGGVACALWHVWTYGG